MRISKSYPSSKWNINSHLSNASPWCIPTIIGGVHTYFICLCSVDRKVAYKVNWQGKIGGFKSVGSITVGL